MSENPNGVFERDKANPPHAAPGLIGPGSVLDWASGVPSQAHPRPYLHLHLEIDLAGGQTVEVPFPHLEALRGVLHARRIVESEDLLTLVGQTLSGLGAIGLQRVRNWQLLPTGSFPLPPTGEHLGGEALGSVLRAMRDEAMDAVRQATGFHAQVHGADGNAADVMLRHDHTRNAHALSLDLTGSFTRDQLKHLLTALSHRLPVARAEVTKYATDAPRTR
ncbi:MAG: hypothetical protein WAN87_10265 [Thermoplasmata archaeon]